MYIPRFSESKQRLVEVHDSYQYVPLLSKLKALISEKTVNNEIQTLSECIHNDGLLEDFCDGARFKSHPLFFVDKCALQIVAHYDEVELCNPLGAHVKKHKVGLVAYTLGNVHPKYRSKLKLTQLAIV